MDEMLQRVVSQLEFYYLLEPNDEGNGKESHIFFPVLYGSGE